MTSVLRLGNKDRSPFQFFKRQNNASDVPSDSLAHRLPDILPLDTRSFAGLFDEFMSNENSDSLPIPKHYPAATPSALRNGIEPNVSTYSALPAKALDTKVEFLKASISRNDSTGSSCYSQLSHRDSDFSPPVTRQSSSSSYTPEPSPALSRTITTKLKPSIISKRPAPALSSHLTESPISAPLPLRANSSLTRIVSIPPDLDKPLPPGPIDVRKASASVPDLLLCQPPAELPSELTPQLTTYGPSPVEKTYPQPQRMVSTRRASDSGTASELPTWSSGSIREPRTAKPLTHSHHRNRSVSDTEVPQYGRPHTDKSRRHTADMQKLVSTIPSSSRATQASRRHSNRPIAASTAEHVIYRIMCSLHSAEDLQATAMVSKGFLRTFQRNESKLVSHLIFKQSRAAWELRRSILALKESNDFLLKDYRRDCRTIDALRAFIVAHCSASCKRSTLVGLLGQDEARRAQIDNALWRIWTFCTLFGNTVGQSGPAQIEIDWLNGSRAASSKQLGAGFSIGNGKGLLARELEDMNEMWQCLQVLVSGFHGREQEAKRYGVFDNWHLRETTTDAQHLVEWTSYLLALGPQTVLSLSSCSFEQAKMLGLTTWALPQAGQSRFSFLTSAISHVYQERILEDATRRAAHMSIRRPLVPPRAPLHRPARSLDEKQLVPAPLTRVEKLQTQSLRIDTSGQKRRPVSTNMLASTKLEIRPDCDPASTKLDIRPDCDPVWRTSQASHLLPTSPTADPTVYHSLTMTSTASAKLGATLFPMDYASPAPRVPFPASKRATARVSQVIDPVDKAMTFLVHEMGFGETRARKALALCDTGSGIDLQKAVELLTVDSKDEKQQALPVELPTPGELITPNWPRKQQTVKAYCDGHCKRTSTISHSRNHSGTTGTFTDVSDSPVSVLDEAEWQDTISPLTGTALSTSRRGTLNRGSSKAKAWKVLGMDGAPKRKNSVLRIDEYQAKVERRKSMRAAANTGQPSPKVKEGLSRNLLGLGLGIGSSAGAKSVEAQLDRARDDERRKKEKNQTSSMPRYA